MIEFLCCRINIKGKAAGALTAHRLGGYLYRF